MKRIIINFLNKKFQDRKFLKIHQGHFLFYRWLAYLVIDRQNTSDVLYSIARYMCDHKLNLPFNDIFVVGDNVYIYTSRPGIWIGKMGSNHDAVVYAMNHDIEGKEIHNFTMDYIEDFNSAQCEISKNINFFKEY